MEDKIKRIEALLYIALIILVINTIAIFVSLGDTKEEESEPTITDETPINYDVSMFKTITTDEFIDAYNGDTIQVVYFGRSNCGFCVQMLPSLQKAQNEYGYKTLYVDITTINSENQEKIKALDEFFNESYGRTPMIVLVKNGKIIDKQLGYTEYEIFAQLLENNGFTK